MDMKLFSIILWGYENIKGNFHGVKNYFPLSPRVMSSQYGGGCQVQWRVPSTVEGYLAVQWGAIMKYSGGCGVWWRAI